MGVRRRLDSSIVHREAGILAPARNTEEERKRCASRRLDGNLDGLAEGIVGPGRQLHGHAIGHKRGNLAGTVNPIYQALQRAEQAFSEAGQLILYAWRDFEEQLAAGIDPLPADRVDGRLLRLEALPMPSFRISGSRYVATASALAFLSSLGTLGAQRQPATLTATLPASPLV